MEITWALIFGFSICFLSILINHKYLIYAGLFFFSFTATVVVNFESGQAISLFFLIGLFISLALIFSLLRDVANKKIIFSKYSVLPIQFAIVIFFSMFMPIWINGSLEVDSNQLSVDYFSTPIYFSLNTVLKIFPPMVGFFVTLSILRFIDNDAIFFKASKCLILSIAFIACWGLLQLICNLIPFLEYPDYIFNNISSKSARGFQQILESEDVASSFSRLSSVTHEPSTFVKHLLIPIPIIYLSILSKDYLFSKRLDQILLMLLVLLILLATSTTGIIGLISCFILINLFLSLYYEKKFFSRIFSLIFISALIVTITFLFFPSYIQLVIVDKLTSTSGLARILSLVNSWQYFLMYPVYGVGWNNVTVNDLIVNLLVNIGLIGLISFLSLFIFSVRWAMKDIRIFVKNNFIVNNKNLRLKNHLCGFLISFINIVILGIFTGIEFYMGYFYVILGMLYASSNIISKINTQ
ncbi:MAG: hypothetical protein CMD72_03525 [Gammaproteobacteria bacterium]|nr:hypothetical protein [Gammaproteobacteria bacterium]|tara:strand:+ start:110 stop:1513 length:1404 start_codon:yes stop_codon:yes gene_type:complete